MSRPSLKEANKFYVETLATLSNTRAAAAFAAVWQAIETLASTGAEITVANVAKVCATLPGGPREQSIRNDKARMKRLVQLAMSRKDLRNISHSIEPSRVERGDLNLRINALELENRLLRADNNRMRQAFKTYSFHRSEDDAFEIKHPPQIIFTKDERAAVTQFIRELASEGLWFDPNSGEIVKENGRTFANTGFIAALKKILADEKTVKTEPT